MEGIDLAGVVDSDFQGIQINFAPPPAPPRRICQFSRGGAGRTSLVIMQRVCDHASCNADILRQHSGETNATDATIVCPRKCIVASIAFVWFFSTVYSQMLPPIVCITWSMITLTLHDYMLKRFLSRMGHCGIPCAFSKRCHILTTPNTVKMCCGVVHFQMCPQTSDKMGNYENDGTPQDSRAV